MIPVNQYHSYSLNGLPSGCQQCVRGEKLVLFVTGLCPRRCYFCPVSDHKFGHDVTFANERHVNAPEDILLEANHMRAHGAGITGGDPLMRLDRTVSYIHLLKEKYGKSFHIHLYTSLNLVSMITLQQLSDAGLDEIRFHLDLDSTVFWERLSMARHFAWTVGVEDPLIPTKRSRLIQLIDFVHDKIDFLTLNELEVADNSQSRLLAMGFTVKNRLSYAVKGSLEMGLELIKYVKAQGYPLDVHVCTAKLKDAIQLSNRIKRQACCVKQTFDRVDDEGLLVRGALYLPDLSPGIGYRKKLAAVDKQPFIFLLESKLGQLKDHLHLSSNALFIDHEKPRILLSEDAVRRYAQACIDCGLVPAVVTEYPTADQLEVDIEFL